MFWLWYISIPVIPSDWLFYIEIHKLNPSVIAGTGIFCNKQVKAVAGIIPLWVNIITA